jgi:hypothetical protein
MNRTAIKAPHPVYRQALTLGKNTTMKYKCILIGLIISSSAISAESKYPRLERAELSAEDLASILGIKTVKWRLPNKDGCRLSSYQVIFRASDGKEQPLSDPIEYNYDPNKMDDIGELVVSLVPKDGAYELYLKTKNYYQSKTHQIPIKMKNYVMAYTQVIEGGTGVTVDKYAVPSGDSIIFRLSECSGDKNTVPDIIILRTLMSK